MCIARGTRRGIRGDQEKIEEQEVDQGLEGLGVILQLGFLLLFEFLR